MPHWPQGDHTPSTVETGIRRARAVERLVLGASLVLLAWGPARAQTLSGTVYSLYFSTRTPAYYRRGLTGVVMADARGNVLTPRAFAGAFAGARVSTSAAKSPAADSSDRSSPPHAGPTACTPLRRGCQPLRLRNLPPNARLRVYTLTGALVKDMSVDGAGQASWDGTNQGGRPVSSGVFVVVVQGAGAPQTFKVAVQR